MAQYLFNVRRCVATPKKKLGKKGKKCIVITIMPFKEPLTGWRPGP